MRRCSERDRVRERGDDREVITSPNDSSLVDNAARGTIHDAVRAAIGDASRPSSTY
jgi:hypothetical protein